MYKPSELHKLGIKPKKSLSQNFLIDQNIIKKLCKIANIQVNDPILEIGPGLGAITEQLIKEGAKVTAVEIDKKLVDQLSRRISSKFLSIFCDDALTFSLDTISSKTKVVANLPFHISTALIARFIRDWPRIDTLTCIVHKEIGEKITAKKNSSSYNSFTLFTQAFCTPKYCFTITPSAFFPKPSVQSCVIHLTVKPFPFPFSQEAFFSFIRTIFQQRRKMLRASLKDSFSRTQIESALKDLSLPLTARPQELSLDEFASFFQILQKNK